MTEKTYTVLRPYRDRHLGRVVEKDEVVQMQPRIAAHMVGSHLALADSRRKSGKTAKTTSEGSDQ